MADIGMTLNALRLMVCIDDLMDEITVTIQALLLKDTLIAWDDLDGLVEIVEGKGPCMAKAIVGLGDIFWEKPTRGMAIVAGRHMLVAAVHPGIILGIHDMTIDADLWIIVEIGLPLGIEEGKESYPHQDTDTEGEKDSKEMGWEILHQRDQGAKRLEFPQIQVFS